MAAGNSRGMMRPHNSSRAPSFIVIGLLVVIAILGFNFWSVSSRNTLLTRELEEVSDRLRTLAVKKLSIERRSQEYRDQYTEQKQQHDKKVTELEFVQSDLSVKIRDLEECGEELEDAEKEMNDCRSNLTSTFSLVSEKEDEVFSLKENIKSDNTHFEQTLQSLVNNCSDTYARILESVQKLWGGRGLQELRNEGIDLGNIQVDLTLLGRLSPENNVAQVPVEPSNINQQPVAQNIEDTNPVINSNVQPINSFNDPQVPGQMNYNDGVGRASQLEGEGLNPGYLSLGGDRERTGDVAGLQSNYPAVPAPPQPGIQQDTDLRFQPHDPVEQYQQPQIAEPVVGVQNTGDDAVGYGNLNQGGSKLNNGLAFTQTEALNPQFDDQSKKDQINLQPKLENREVYEHLVPSSTYVRNPENDIALTGDDHSVVHENYKVNVNSQGFGSPDVSQDIPHDKIGDLHAQVHSVDSGRENLMEKTLLSEHNNSQPLDPIFNTTANLNGLLSNKTDQVADPASTSLINTTNFTVPNPSSDSPSNTANSIQGEPMVNKPVQGRVDYNMAGDLQPVAVDGNEDEGGDAAEQEGLDVDTAGDEVLRGPGIEVPDEDEEEVNDDNEEEEGGGNAVEDEAEEDQVDDANIKTVDDLQEVKPNGDEQLLRFKPNGEELDEADDDQHMIEESERLDDTLGQVPAP